MNKCTSLLALTLAACGNSATSTTLPDGSTNCKGNRVWNATLEECVEPTVDASVSLMLQLMTQDMFINIKGSCMVF